MTVPIECFTVRLEVHRAPGVSAYGWSMEVYDPHTKERVAMVVEPMRPAQPAVALVSHVTLDLRAVLLELTDPDPF